MTAENWNTFFAGGTFLVITATAIAAIVQLRHLRASNQLSALVAILRDWQTPEMQGWVRFVREQLADKVAEPRYLESITGEGMDRSLHPWLNICDYYEQLGSYIKYGLVDRQSFLDVSSFAVVGFYRRLQPCIERLRAVRNNNAIYENFEYIAVLALEFERKYSQGNYPNGMRRFSDFDEGKSG